MGPVNGVELSLQETAPLVAEGFVKAQPVVWRHAMMSEEEALDAWSEANDFSPEAPHWGFFAMDANPIGVGGFTWFPTRDEMLQFFWEIIPPAMANDSGAPVRKMMKATRGHVSRHQLGETSLEQ